MFSRSSERSFQPSVGKKYPLPTFPQDLQIASKSKDQSQQTILLHSLCLLPLA